MDDKLFSFINQLSGRFRWVDCLMIFISQRLRYLFALVMIIMWFYNKFSRKITVMTGIATIITYLITSIIKHFYFKPRPFIHRTVHLLEPVPHKDDSSFPSKHTTLAFVAAISVLLYKRTLGILMTILAFFAGFSRIWMGQHYPSDIIGSALIGSLTAAIVHFSENLWETIINRINNVYKSTISKL